MVVFLPFNKNASFQQILSSSQPLLSPLLLTHLLPLLPARFCSLSPTLSLSLSLSSSVLYICSLLAILPLEITLYITDPSQHAEVLDYKTSMSLPQAYQLKSTNM